jgi:hypothetical protein
VESALVEVLILDGLPEDVFYKMVIRVGLKILVGLEGRLGGGA